ncbi:MAG: MBL fold metallo-hydrolase [Dehalococcoidia bacterium]|nr:MBL fold metallo-hydrolase [Dehalococcoidia bacterium]
MARPFQVWEDIYTIGGPDLSAPDDCCVYLVKGSEPVMIDAGAGRSFDKLQQNIKRLGVAPEELASIIVTHAHIDHIGALQAFQSQFGTKIVAHELDTHAIETGEGTFAEFYGTTYLPCKVNLKLSKPEGSLTFGEHQFRVVHIPGHTPGSIAIYLDMAGKRVLFGQDIHGPYNPQWGADPSRARTSLKLLSNLNADILCEGHFGIYRPASEVNKYIQSYLRMLPSH